MGKDKVEKKRATTELFCQHHHWFDRCEAWRSLKPLERAVYYGLKVRYNGRNNGFIHASVRYLGEYANVSKSSAARALDTLKRLGFIKVAEPSAFSMKARKATVYTLTELKDDRNGGPATKEFMRPKKITVP